MTMTTDGTEKKYEATPFELFFDLVFVFAVLQLSHHLLAHLSWRGAAEVLVLLLAVFAVWSYTSWAATMIPVEQAPTCWMLLTVMLLGLFMNALVTTAFTTSGWAFVISLLLIQLGRTIWTLVNTNAAVYREHFIRVLLWIIATTPLWIVGAAVNTEARLLWWTLASVIDLIGTWLAHPIPWRWLRSENVWFAGGHGHARPHGNSGPVVVGLQTCESSRPSIRVGDERSHLRQPPRREHLAGHGCWAYCCGCSE